MLEMLAHEGVIAAFLFLFFEDFSGEKWGLIVGAGVVFVELDEGVQTVLIAVLFLAVGEAGEAAEVAPVGGFYIAVKAGR